MNKKCFLLAAVLIVCALDSSCNSLFGETGQRTPRDQPCDRPNIVLIILDDLGYGDAGCCNPLGKIPTPHIDRLATEGMRFTDAHAPGATCVVSRYGLLTGRYPSRSRRCRIHSGTPTIASLLKDHSYRTAMVGKWHNGFDATGGWQGKLEGGPRGCGFDYFFGIPHSLDIQPYLYIENDRVVRPPTETIARGKEVTAGIHPTEGWSKIQGAFWRKGRIARGFKHDEVLGKFTDKAIALLQDHRRQHADRPFFLYLAHAGPHTPWLPSKEFRGRSGAGLYGDYLMEIDAAVGRVIGTLDELEVKQNTLIMLTSDNGPVWYAKDVARFGHDSVGPLRGMKGDAFEGGHRVPLIASWPGKIPRGSVCDEVVCLTDVMRTFAAILGAELPEGVGVDSVNLLPLLLGEKQGPVRDVTVHRADFLAIRKGPYKLLDGRGSGGFSRAEVPADAPPGQLYDLENDLREERNLYRQRPEVVKELKKRLEQYRE